MDRASIAGIGQLSITAFGTLHTYGASRSVCGQPGHSPVPGDKVNSSLVHWLSLSPDFYVSSGNLLLSCLRYAGTVAAPVARFGCFCLSGFDVFAQHRCLSGGRLLASWHWPRAHSISHGRGTHAGRSKPNSAYKASNTWTKSMRLPGAKRNDQHVPQRWRRSRADTRNTYNLNRLGKSCPRSQIADNGAYVGWNLRAQLVI